MLGHSAYLRDKFSSKGYQPLGRVSPFVCVKVGNEVYARMIAKALMENGNF